MKIHLGNWLGHTSLLVIFCLGMFVFIGAYNINAPGLYYDEALFVNAAIGGETDLFVFKRIGDLPVMLMPYIGALKAWLYYPIFKVFGIDYSTIRLPAILLGALALGLTWKYVHHSFGSTAASIFLIMAAVEPSSIFHSRLDWGPTALMMVFRGGLLLSLAYWFHSGKSKYLLLAITCAGLGTFDKLNFIWIASSAFVAGVLVYPDRFCKSYLLKHKNIVIAALAIAVALSIVFVKILGIRLIEEVGITDFGKRISIFLHLLILTLRGEGVYQFIIQGGNKAFDLHAYALMATSFFALWGIYRGIRDRRLAVRPLVYLALVILFLAIQIFFTKKATGPHHFATFAPLWLIFMAVGLSNALIGFQKHRLVIARALIGVPIILILSTSMNVNLLYHAGVKNSIGNPHWDPASSTQLVSILISNDVNSIVAVDWGIATNVQSLSDNRIRVSDLWPMFNGGLDESQSRWIRSEFMEKGAVFVLHTEGREAFPAARRHFMEVARNSGWNLQQIAVIKSIDDKPYIEILKPI